MILSIQDLHYRDPDRRRPTAARLLHQGQERGKLSGDWFPPAAAPQKNKYVFLNIIYLFYTTQRLPGVDSKAKAEDSSSPSESGWPK